MASSFTAFRYHAVFSTKNRSRLITPDWEPELYAYLAGILQETGGRLLEGNGTEDHVHLLFALRADQSPAAALRILKCNSSKWIHEKWRKRRDFEWQRGYFGTTVSHSQIDRVRTYIQNQKEHHRRVSFQEEFVRLLKAHGIEYDERYIWN
ncbi:MAG: IS200/IS605 family transposase [Acidobacteriia bacterium]|nr:IS200/IS605 family transposase [Terriglobia bacterium]